MSASEHDLTFEFLDDLALAVRKGRVDPAAFLAKTRVIRLGPFLELLALGRCSPMPLTALPMNSPKYLLQNALAPARLGRGNFVEADGERMGFITTTRTAADEDRVEWVRFCLKAQEAAELSLPKPVARGLIGAMREIEGNVDRHSGRSHDGVTAFRGTRDDFEFVVADSGVGILNSLRQSPDYQHLNDSGIAIRTALTDGQSRFRHLDPACGQGFHDLFVGLANLNGELRFHSGDHALTIDGTTPSLVTARLGQKAHLQGFVASVVCRLTPFSIRH